MLTALLLAVACANPPLYDMSGPECVTPTVPCQCSECATWAPLPNAIRYQVNRTDPNGVERLVGTTAIHGNYIDEDGNFVPPNPVEAWCFQRDDPPPVEGVRYTYKFRGCTGASASTCTPWVARNDGLPIVYFGAPMRCYAAGVLVGC
jgi:hypothetical protein